MSPCFRSLAPPPPVLVAGAPTLTDIAANAGAPGAAVNVTLTGTNFASGATVNVSGGTDLVVSNTNVASSTQITATFMIAANATIGARNVTVTVANPTLATVTVGTNPQGVAVNPTTNRIYVANGNSHNSHNVSVIGGASNTVVRTQAVGNDPTGIAVNPTTNRIYVANERSNIVSVLDGSILMSRVLRPSGAPAPLVRPSVR